MNGGGSLRKKEVAINQQPPPTLADIGSIEIKFLVITVSFLLNSN